GFAVERLKAKLGNRSNASAEIRLDGARGTLVGEEGRGVATIIEMVVAPRLDRAHAGVRRAGAALVRRASGLRQAARRAAADAERARRPVRRDGGRDA